MQEDRPRPPPKDPRGSVRFGFWLFWMLTPVWIIGGLMVYCWPFASASTRCSDDAPNETGRT